MKRLFCLLLALVLAAGLCACGKDAPKETTPSTAEGTTTGDVTTTTEGETTTTEDGAETTTSAIADTDGDTTATKTDGTTKVPTTTKKPTTTAKGEDAPAIRVLANGDGCAVDATEKHLYEMLSSAGYGEIHLGVLYADKSTLDTHHTNLKSDKAAYEFRQNTGGKWNTKKNVAPSVALKAADWDYVVIGQSIGDAGLPATYGKLGDLLTLIKKQCDAEIYWNLTWAYQQNCGLKDFANYNYNQLAMYQAIIKTTLQQVMRHADVWALIPTATAIQNLRTSSLRDGLTTDGARLTDTYGDYTAALSWYCSLTGESADTVTYRPTAIADHYDEIAEAVTNAFDLPSQVTPAANGDGEYKSISVLAVGNSFAVDAMVNHLYGMFEASGYDDIHLGILYVGGCSIDMHYNYIKADSGSYEYYENKDGKWVTTAQYKASAAFAAADWDVVTVQQVSSDSGRPNTYAKLDDLLALIRPKVGDAKLYWHMTWAYQQNSNHSAFPNYGKDQMKMYNAIVSTVKEKIVNHPAFDGVIPSGTAIQNLRTSTLGDTLTADGYHLENAYGDYTAALTWYCQLSGDSAYNMYYCPASVADHYREIAEAVDNAVKKPFTVTECK